MLVIKKITPTFNHVLTTKDCYEKDVTINGLIVDKKGTVKNYQRVLAVGPSVKNCKPGDYVMIDPIRYAKMKHENNSLKDGVIGDNPIIAYNIPLINIDGEECMYLFDNDIQFVMDEFEIVDDPAPLFVAQPTIIQ